MDIKEILVAASYCLYKGYNIEELERSDFMSGRSEFVDDVWEHVIAAEENGYQWLREKALSYNVTNLYI